MSMPAKQTFALFSLLIWAVVIGAVQASTRSSALQDLSDGAGAELVRQKCIVCHEADLITQQRLTRTGWTREVEKMIRWGAELSGTEKQVTIDYLAARFGPRRVNPPGPSEKPEIGKAIFEASCLSCHEADLTEQQRLSRSGWTREIDKMIRWGAVVKESDKSALAEYLSGKYGVENRSRK
jgi:mono/diheme cytochrome c family protein